MLSLNDPDSISIWRSTYLAEERLWTQQCNNRIQATLATAFAVGCWALAVAVVLS